MDSYRRNYEVTSLAALILMILFASIFSGLGSGNPKITTIRHHQYVKLKSLASRYRMSVVDLSAGAVGMEGERNSIHFYPGQRKTVFEGVEVWLNGDLERAYGEWFISDVDRRDIIDPLIDPAKHLKGYDCGVVVLDPGHGGRDPGAVSPGGFYEKRFALDIARRTADLLRSSNIRVHLTRDSDKSLQLGFRPRIAQKHAADVFVSIHLNAAAAKSARGVETYRLTASGFPSVENAGEAQFDPAEYNGNGYNGANTLLGFHIQKSLHQITGSPDRGLRHARFAVLKDADCPAVLVECGFLSNQKEEALLATPEYRQKVAVGIANGITHYRSAVNRAKLLAKPVEPSVPDA